MTGGDGSPRRAALRYFKHQMATAVLPAIDGRMLRIRKASTPEVVHRKIQRVLQLPHEAMKLVKTWTVAIAP